MIRFLRHLISGKYTVNKYFPRDSLKNIELVIQDCEKRHNGELVFAVESSLSVQEFIKGVSSRDKALDAFSKLRVWDTDSNSGVLLFLLLADRKLEIVADRGISQKVSATEWQNIIANIENQFRQNRFEKGIILGLSEISEYLSKHFPAPLNKQNELSDTPVILP